MRRTLTSLFLLAVLSIAVSPALLAQDTRNVTEPKFPKSCTVLLARHAAPGGVLSDAGEKQPDTVRIQQAMDHCTPGQAVELKPDGKKNIFLSGPLQLPTGVTLLIDANTALFASRDPRDYDVSPGSCGLYNGKGRGCKPLITAENTKDSGIMGDGAIDGRGGATLIGQTDSWWDLAKKAKIFDTYQTVTRLLVIRKSENFTLYRITLRNSPNFHVSAETTNGFTAWGVKIFTPHTARNTDGIDPSSSTNVTITQCYISTGDDNVAIKSSERGGATNMTITHNHFYHGHGMSIGSGTDGGDSNIYVSDLSLDGTDNGIRIKSDRSRGGLVKDVRYENVCMRNVTNPIVLTSMYTTFGGDRIPVYQNILLKDVRSVTPGFNTVLGVDEQHKVGVTFDNVVVDGFQAKDVLARHSDITLGPRQGNFVPRGEDVTIKEAAESSAATPLSCEGRFPAFPDIPTAPAAKVTTPPEDPTLYVAASGTGEYWSIQRAIDVAPEGATISIAPGIYREVLTINKSNIHLRSPYTDAGKTVVVFDNSAGSTGSTFKSATVTVNGDNFSAENLTFANDYNKTHPQLPAGSQALALSVTGDRAVFRNMRFLGNQDTLYAASRNCTPPDGKSCVPARQYFADCYVEGNVDFIFGDGKAVFERCQIHSNRPRGGYITAQGKHYPEQDSGFVFNHCRLTANPDVKNVWLGRPWRPYASVIMLNTEMGDFMEPAGWREWHPGETEHLKTVFYAEYNSTGPGGAAANRDPHTKQMSAQEAAAYETKRFLAGSDGWDPTAAATPSAGK